MARIVELRIENFRRIKAVDIRPDGGLVVISGKNGAGKTSVLHAIWTVLKGRAVAGPTPISKDAEACTIRCQTDEFTATRTFKHTKEGELTTDLKLVMADGRRITSKPQAMLDALLPDLALDPLAFMRRPAKDQADTVKALVKGFDFAANARERKTAFDDRTAVNRRRDDAKASADSVVLPPGKKPAAVDVSTLLQQMTDAAKHNTDLETRRARRQQAQDDIDSKLDEAEGLRARAATLERDAAELKVKLAEAPALPDPIDVAALQQQVEAAEAVKATLALFDTVNRHRADYEKHAKAADTLTTDIQALDDAKTAAIAAAKLPVPGLSFDDDGLMLNDLPFEQASMAEKLRASVAIGMALCPPPSDPALRIMTVDEGSELDRDGMALLDKMASDHGYQVWIARVDDTGAQGFVIVDGALQEGGK